jgi:hypothetical protein
MQGTVPSTSPSLLAPRWRMAAAGVFQPCLHERPISIWRLWEVFTDTNELHVQYFVDGTLADILPVYIYRRSTLASQFGSETDPDGETRAVPGDRRSPSLRKPLNRDPQQSPWTLPDMIVQWMWQGISLAEMTLRSVDKYARGADLVVIGNGQAAWGDAGGGRFSVNLTVGHETFLFSCTLEDGETRSPLLFDIHLKQWILPDATPARPGHALSWPRAVPRKAMQWLCSEALRLGARRLRGGLGIQTHVAFG